MDNSPHDWSTRNLHASDMLLLPPLAGDVRSMSVATSQVVADFAAWYPSDYDRDGMVWLVQATVDVYWFAAPPGAPDLDRSARTVGTRPGPASQGGILFAGSTRPFYLPKVGGARYSRVHFQAAEAGHVVVHRGLTRV